MKTNDSYEAILSQVEHKAGMIKTFYKDVEGAKELIEIYDAYTKEGTSFVEIKLFLDDLNIFLDGMKEEKNRPRTALEQITSLSKHLPLEILTDINKRCTDWMSTGGKEDDAYIYQQLRFAKNYMEQNKENKPSVKIKNEYAIFFLSKHTMRFWNGKFRHKDSIKYPVVATKSEDVKIYQYESAAIRTTKKLKLSNPDLEPTLVNLSENSLSKWDYKLK